VILDFDSLETNGRAFADEVFRVFAHNNPQIELIPVQMTAAVLQRVQRAMAPN